MAWIDIPQEPNWEYSTDPNTDKKTIDTYDYDINTDHVLGIRTDGDQVWYVLARQKAPISNPGYGEMYFPAFGPNLWNDSLATGETGWTYNEDGTWTAVSATNAGINITSLVSVGDTVEIRFEVISRTAGSIKARVLGTTGVVLAATTGSYLDVITDTSGFTKCGIVAFSGFTGTVRILSFRKKVR